MAATRTTVRDSVGRQGTPQLPIAAAIIAKARNAITDFFETPLLSELPAPRYSTRGTSDGGRPNIAKNGLLAQQRRNALDALQAVIWAVSDKPPTPDRLTLDECCVMQGMTTQVVRERIVAEFQAGPPQHLRYLRELCR